MANQQLGDYRLERMLGRGAMGVVYLAERGGDGQQVAVKVLGSALTQSNDSLQRFRREAAVATRLRHAHLVSVHELGETQGYTFFAMDYVRGVTLGLVLTRMRELRDHGVAEPSLIRVVRELVDGDAGDVAAATEDRFVTGARIVAAVGDALDYAHQNGVLHRDVKPQNVLIDAASTPKLSDFGLAKNMTAESVSRLHTPLGTVPYMSPEMVAQNGAPVDHRTDVYSLGVTLYEVLTLDLPFVGQSVHDLCRRIEVDEPRSLGRFDDRIPRALQAIALKAMDKRPARRFASCGEMAAELRRYLRGEAVRTRMPSPMRRVLAAGRRHPSLLATGAVLLVSLAAVGVVYGIKARRIEALLVEGGRLIREGSYANAATLLASAEGTDPRIDALLRQAHGTQRVALQLPSGEPPSRVTVLTLHGP